MAAKRKAKSKQNRRRNPDDGPALAVPANEMIPCQGVILGENGEVSIVVGDRAIAQLENRGRRRKARR